MRTKRLIWFYRQLLRLYPDSFQAEFGEEMVQTFETAVSEASKQGKIALSRQVAHEFLTLPWPIIVEHWREQKDEPLLTTPRLFRLLCFGVYVVNIAFPLLILLPHVSAVSVFPESGLAKLFVYVGILGSLAASFYAFRDGAVGGLWMMRLSPLLWLTASLHFNSFDNTPLLTALILGLILALPLYGLGWLMHGISSYGAVQLGQGS